MSRITWRHIVIGAVIVALGVAVGVGVILLINPIADQESSPAAPTIAVALPDTGIEIALNPQDQAFVDGLKARGLNANDADPGLARAYCSSTKSLLQLGNPDSQQGGAIAYKGMLNQAAVFYKDPAQAQMFVDSTIATYCDDLTWIELAQP